MSLLLPWGLSAVVPCLVEQPLQAHSPPGTGSAHSGGCRQHPAVGGTRINPKVQVNRFIPLCRVLICGSAPWNSAYQGMFTLWQLTKLAFPCSEAASKCSTLQITLITTAVFAFFQSPNNGLTILDCLLTLQCDNEIQNITAAQNPSLLFWVSLLIQRATAKYRDRKNGTKASDNQKQASQ